MIVSDATTLRKFAILVCAISSHFVKLDDSEKKTVYYVNSLCIKLSMFNCLSYYLADNASLNELEKMPFVCNI